MNSKLVVTAAVLIVAIIGIAFIAMGATGTNKGSNSSPNPALNSGGANASNTNTSKVLFSTSQYAQYSYLISTDNLSQQAKAALSGYNLSTSILANGSRSITISLVGTSANQTIILKPGYKLYIVETTFGDDSFGRDSNLGDDGFLLVDPNGYIV